MKLLFLMFFISVIHASWVPVSFDKDVTQKPDVWVCCYSDLGDILQELSGEIQPVRTGPAEPFANVGSGSVNCLCQLQAHGIIVYYGAWYVNAWTGNVDIPEDKRHQKIPPFTVKPLPNGKWEAKLNLKKNGRCEEIKLTLEKTKEPGKLSTWGRQIIGILSVNVEGQLIVYIESKMNGKSVTMMQLAGRKPVANPEAMKIFKKFVQSKGQDETKIIIPELEEDCVPGRA